MRGWGAESDTPDLPLVVVQGLQMSGASDVMELHLARLPRHHQQPTCDHGAHHGSVVSSLTCGVHTRGVNAAPGLDGVISADGAASGLCC